MRILRVVGSGRLPCGCLVGVYETFSGRTVRIVDQSSERCVLRHRVGSTIPGGAIQSPEMQPLIDHPDGASAG